MPRILHIIDSIARDGTTKQLLLLCQELKRAGWDVDVAALRGAGPRPASSTNSVHQEFAAAPIPVTYLGRRWPLDPLADYRLARHVAHLAPDVVHTWNTIPGLFGPVINRKNRCPRIIGGFYRINRLLPAWDSFFLHRFAHSVDQFVTNSAAVRDWHIAKGLPAAKFAIIPSGVKLETRDWGLGTRENFPAPSPKPPAPLRDLHLPPNARLIGVIGHLTHENRVKDLIWAADLLRVLHDNLRLLIIGDGPQRDALVRYARMASDLDHIRFLGERADVERILPHLDVLWNARENTGQSLAVLEAMAAGVPVIASDTPSNRELVVENESGYLIPLGTRAGRAARARHTDRIFKDPLLAKRIAHAARERVQKLFSADEHLRSMIALYEKMAR
jgi:glycosyltransferase involved in cell wall biosynthesis